MLPLLIGAGTSILGSIFGNKKSARTSTNTPTVAPEFKTLNDLLRTRAEERLRSNVDLSGLQANGLSGINDVFSGIESSQNANLTARGLASSPVAGAVGANRDLARGGQMAEFLNTLPLLQRQFQDQDFSNASRLVAQNTGNVGVGPGSAVGAGLDDLSSWLGYIFRQRQLGG